MIGFALFTEPVRGTLKDGTPVMILGVQAVESDDDYVFGVDGDGNPGWWKLEMLTFDWRWSPGLGRWADLEEIENTPLIDPATE